MNSRYWVLIVGSYAGSEEKGIESYLFDRNLETFVPYTSLSGVENPSFLTLDYKNGIGYAVSETNEGSVFAFTLGSGDKEPLIINEVKTHGSSPCYVEKNENTLYTVNYMGGNVTVFPLQDNGKIGEAIQTIAYEGSSVNQERQEASHPHTIVKDPLSPYVFITNLGTDHLHVYEPSMESGRLEHRLSVQTKLGMGPRHLAIHPKLPYVYVSGELDSTVAVYKWDRTQVELEFVEAFSTLPGEFTGENTVAEVKLAPSGQHLYVSNRGHDSLVVYDVQDDGLLQVSEHLSTQGKGPRHFTLLPTEDYLIVANQFSDSIYLYRKNNEGKWMPTETVINKKSPVCLQVMPLKD